nr:DUF5460 family protein [Rickettsia endosymbiont of Ceutorhynchus assimilis]
MPNFSCLIPIFKNEIFSTLVGNTKQGFHHLGNKVYTSIFTEDNKKISGIFVESIKCNFNNLIKQLNDANPFALQTNCENLVNIKDIFTNDDTQKFLILEQHTTVENDTANILGKSYNVTDNVISLNDIASFLGLEDCTTESALRAVQDYLFSLIPTTTTTTTTTELINTTIAANNLTTEYNPALNNDESGTEINPYLIVGAAATTTLLIGGCIGTAIGYYWGKKNATTTLNGKVFSNADQLQQLQEEGIPLTGVEDHYSDKVFSNADQLQQLQEEEISLTGVENHYSSII